MATNLFLEPSAVLVSLIMINRRAQSTWVLINAVQNTGSGVILFDKIKSSLGWGEVEEGLEEEATRYRVAVVLRMSDSCTASTVHARRSYIINVSYSVFRRISHGIRRFH